jgi:glycerophosphoryl diester phosphodiesterase
MQKKIIGSILSLGSSKIFAALKADNEVIQYNGKPVQTRPQIYSHRAGRGLMPEQTMPAYLDTLGLGIDYVDMDIAMTKDNVLVVTHDLTLNPDLTRDEKGKWVKKRIPVNKLTLAELQKYNVGKLKPGTKYASFFPNQKSLDTPIPTLKEVVEKVKKITGDKVGFQIEIKNHPLKPKLSPTPKEFAAALYKFLKEEDIINRTEVQAFDWRCLVELQKLDPNIKTAYLSDKTTETMTAKEKGTWTAGLLPKNFGYSLPKMVKHLGGYCWEPFEMELTKDLLDEAHKLGLKVVAWGWPEMEKTEFNYDQIQKLIAWGIDGIITDRPDILRVILTSRGYNLPEGFKIS